MHASQINSTRQLQIANLKTVRIRITLGRKWIVRRSQIRGFSEGDGLRQIHIRWHRRIIRAPGPSHNGTNRRIDVVIHFERWLITRHHPLRAHAVSCIRVECGTNDCQFVHQARLARQVFADLDARDVRRNRTELPANFCRCMRLQVVHVEMTWATCEPDQNHGLLLHRLSGFCRLSLLPQQIRQRHTADAKRPDPQKAATRRVVECEHWCSPREKLPACLRCVVCTGTEQNQSKPERRPPTKSRSTRHDVTVRNPGLRCSGNEGGLDPAYAECKLSSD